MGRVNGISCNGAGANPRHYDDVEVQAALDNLPAEGGTLYLEGTLTFSSTVSRAIDNVTILGQGLTTRINFDGANPVFSAGSQDGWVFRDFDTDAGGVDVASATNSAVEFWKDGTPSYSTLTIASGLITVPGAGFYIVQPETGLTDILTGIVDECDVGTRIVVETDPAGNHLCLVTLHPTGNIGTPTGEDIVLGHTGIGGVYSTITVIELIKTKANASVAGTGIWDVVGAGPIKIGNDGMHSLVAQSLDGATASTTQKGHVKMAAYCDPATATAADVINAMLTAGLMHAAP